MMLNDEHIMLRDVATRWVHDRAPVAAFRKVDTGVGGSGWDRTLFAEMAELGFTGILCPESEGGADLGCVGMGVVLEALGRNLVASPLLSSAMIGASALQLGGSAEQKERWLGRIVDGSCIVALAVDEGPRHRPDHIELRAKANGDGWSLTGRKNAVIDGMQADLLIVAARADADTALFLVEANAAGICRKPLERVDGRSAAIIDFADVRVTKDTMLTGGASLLEMLLDRARAGLAAEMLGGALQAFETTVDYLKIRSQFGQIIGSFQALQHRAAHLFGELQLARAAVTGALAALDADDGEIPMRVSLAKALAGETFMLAAKEMVQMHGGIGMTEEHDAGLYLKRAMAANETWGNAAFHRERFGRLTGH